MEELGVLDALGTPVLPLAVMNIYRWQTDVLSGPDIELGQRPDHSR
jgi:hypothetical protein